MEGWIGELNWKGKKEQVSCNGPSAADNFLSLHCPPLPHLHAALAGLGTEQVLNLLVVNLGETKR